jgi:hypothetical protein
VEDALRRPLLPPLGRHAGMTGDLTMRDIGGLTALISGLRACGFSTTRSWRHWTRPGAPAPQLWFIARTGMPPATSSACTWRPRETPHGGADRARRWEWRRPRPEPTRPA